MNIAALHDIPELIVQDFRPDLRAIEIVLVSRCFP